MSIDPGNPVRSPWMLVLLVAALVGCGAHHQSLRISPRDALYRAKYSAPTVPRSVLQASLEVAILSAPSVECSLVVSPARFSSQVCQDRLGEPRRGSVVLEDLGPVVAGRLRERLGERFRAVNVHSGPTVSMGTVAVRITAQLSAPPDSHKEVSLTAEIVGQGGPPLVATGTSRHRMSRAHFGWIIPLAVLLWPSSMLWLPPAVSPLGQKHDAIAISEAADRAAIALGDQLVARFTDHPRPGD